MQLSRYGRGDPRGPDTAPWRAADGKTIEDVLEPASSAYDGAGPPL